LKRWPNPGRVGQFFKELADSWEMAMVLKELAYSCKIRPIHGRAGQVLEEQAKSW
jgi:hypothetical protein